MSFVWISFKRYPKFTGLNILLVSISNLEKIIYLDLFFKDTKIKLYPCGSSGGGTNFKVGGHTFFMIKSKMFKNIKSNFIMVIKYLDINATHVL